MDFGDSIPFHWILYCKVTGFLATLKNREMQNKKALTFMHGGFSISPLIANENNKLKKYY